MHFGVACEKVENWADSDRSLNIQGKIQHKGLSKTDELNKGMRGKETTNGAEDN